LFDVDIGCISIISRNAHAQYLVVVLCADVPNYFDFITDPMDLGTVQKRMNSSRYDSHEQWADDVRKVWANAMLFNHAGENIRSIMIRLKSSLGQKNLGVQQRRDLSHFAAACFSGYLSAQEKVLLFEQDRQRLFFLENRTEKDVFSFSDVCGDVRLRCLDPFFSVFSVLLPLFTVFSLLCMYVLIMGDRKRRARVGQESVSSV